MLQPPVECRPDSPELCFTLSSSLALHVQRTGAHDSASSIAKWHRAIRMGSEADCARPALQRLLTGFDANLAIHIMHQSAKRLPSDLAQPALCESLGERIADGRY